MNINILNHTINDLSLSKLFLSQQKWQKHKKTEDLGSGGRRMGYHSEKANPSKHSKRLHTKSKKI
jgi:hypothetical protein